MNPVRWPQVLTTAQNDILKASLDVRLVEDELARLHVNQMFHFTVKIHLASVKLLCMSPSQLLCRASEERSHISLSGDRLEIKVLIIHWGLLPGNRPPLAELVCWLKRSKDERRRWADMYDMSDWMFARVEAVILFLISNKHSEVE